MPKLHWPAWLNREFNSLTIKSKLRLCLALPFFSMLLFAASSILVQYQQLTTAVRTSDFISFTLEVIKLTDELQQERGLTAGYLGSKGTNFLSELKLQTIDTDQQISHYRLLLLSEEIHQLYPNLAQELSQIESYLQQLPIVRRQRRADDAQASFDFYSTLISQALRLIQHLQNLSPEGQMVRQSNALMQLLWLKERAGQERGALNGVFGSGRLSAEQYRKISAYLAEQQTYLSNFYAIGQDADAAQLKRYLAEPFNNELSQLRLSAIEKATRNEMLSELQTRIGYVGLIHYFKNFIIRGKPEDAERARELYRQVTEQLAQYRQQSDLGAAEREALNTIEATFAQYARHLDAVSRMRADNISIVDIDNSVRVDDQPALAAIELLKQDVTRLDTSDWWPLASRRIALINQVAETIRRDLKNQAEAQVAAAYRSVAFYLLLSVLTTLVVMHLSFLLQRRLVGNLDYIARNIRAMQFSGNYDNLLEIQGNDELSQLAHTFNGMLLQRQQAEAGMRLAKSVFEHASDAIMVLDDQEHIEVVNPSFTRITGYSAGEAQGRSPSLLKSGRHGADFYHRMRQKLQDEGSWQGEIWNRRKNGEVYPEMLSISAIRDDEKQINRYICLFTDITQRKKYEQSIWQQANFDTLTKLPNRKLFMDHLSHEIKTAKRNREKLALLFIDLDRFKLINDTLGHKAGDELLLQTAQRLAGAVRDSDIVARLGGDEFVIIASGITNVIDAEQIAEKVLAGLAPPFLLNGSCESVVSASIGVTLYPDDGKDVSALLRNSDTAMYRAKAMGRNTFKFFTDEMNAQVMTHMLLEQELRKAVREQQFCLHYQPVIDLDSGQITGAEALLRWQHPERGLIYPDEFIKVAEETGLIVPIGDWVLREAAKQAKRWNRRGQGFSVAVNVSGNQLLGNRRDNLINIIDQILTETGLDAECLQIELTETVLMDKTQETISGLQQLRDLGLDMLLDDFGTGYSSLGYLKHYPINHLKIDRSFIKDVLNSREDACLVEAVLVMAHSLNLKVVAEGIETPEHLDYLKTLGCEFGQGYLFAKPMPAESLDRLREQQLWPHERTVEPAES